MSSPNTLITFERVTKEFVLRRPQARSLRHNLIELLKRGLGRGTPHVRDVFTALREVSFDVQRGETLGIIGENGSGKSTILKLVTRIFEPTSGKVTVQGRIAALLELGAGFHPELTGRENIYLNGSILGMSQKQIDYKLDEIVAFTEIEPFIDVPVKHYSSGMYMRLGFAVAVHVEPEVLLVDEVLAVGDHNFQRKCLERINRLRQEGVTIIFVSHDLDSVRKLCTRTLWLEHSRVRENGPTDAVVDRYLSYMLSLEAPSQTVDRFGSFEVEITNAEFCNARGETQDEFKTGETLVARIHYQAHQAIVRPVFGVAIYRADGTHITGPNTDFSGYTIPAIEGEGTLDLIIDRLPFLEGNYEMTIAVYDEARIHPFDSRERGYRFRVVPGGVREQYGIIHLPVRWDLKANENGHG